MKKTNLMIGDWLNTSRGIAKVIAVDKIGLTFKIDGGDFDIDKNDEEEWFEPIPLTAEILEKNGFETEDAKDGGFVLCDDFYDIFIYEWSDSIWVARYESTEMNIPFEQATMGYVHELQHFLRTSGIEKEIEL